MILSGSYILLLDPSGGYLPEDSRRNSYVVSLDKMRRYVIWAEKSLDIPRYTHSELSLYPGHLKLFHNLFGFEVEHDHYSGVSLGTSSVTNNLTF